MEISFKTQLLRDLYESKKVNDREFRSNPSLIKQYIKTVKILESIERIERLKEYNGLNYEKLKGDRKNYSSVRVNKQYRLIFMEIMASTYPLEVVILEIEEISKHYE